MCEVSYNTGIEKKKTSKKDLEKKSQSIPCTELEGRESRKATKKLTTS